MTLLDRIRALLQADGVPSQDGRGEIRFLTKCQNLSISMRIRLGPDLVLVFSQLPIFAPVYRRPALCETIARANYGLYLGNFEMDMADGEIRFKSSLPINDAEPSDNQLRRLIANSMGVISHYGPALLDVACTEIEPALAIDKADANWKELQRNRNVPEHKGGETCQLEASGVRKERSAQLPTTEVSKRLRTTLMVGAWGKQIDMVFVMRVAAQLFGSS